MALPPHSARVAVREPTRMNLRTVLPTVVTVAALGVALSLYLESRSLRRKLLVAESQASVETAARKESEAQIFAAHTSKIAQLQAELERVQAAAAFPADPAAEQELNAWFGRITTLRSYLADHPQHRIPEMRLLQVKDWLDATKETELKSEADVRVALAKLRSSAKEYVRERLASAVKSFMQTSGEQPPGDKASLVAFLKNPADAEFLERYRLTRPGEEIASLKRLTSLGKPTPPVILVEQPVDPVWEGSLYFTAQGAIVQGVPAHLLTAVTTAAQSYQAAHGSAPTDGAQLAPYLTAKISPEAVAEIFRASRTPLD